MTREELERLLPWPAPSQVYDDDGVVCDVLINGHNFIVRDSGAVGCDSGRTRWTVSCLTCGEVLHPATTSATAHIRRHLHELEPKPPRELTEAEELAQVALELRAHLRAFARLKPKP